MHPVPQSATVQRPAQGRLDPRVSSPLSAHGQAHALGGRDHLIHDSILAPVRTTQRSRSRAKMMPTLRADESYDPVGRHLRTLVLPDPDRFAPCSRQPLVGVAITVLVGGDLAWPVPAVGTVLPTAVLGAAVPDAPVDEDSDLGTSEGDVGLPGEVGQRSSVDAVAQPSTAQNPPQAQLRSRVPGLNRDIRRLTSCVEGMGSRPANTCQVPRSPRRSRAAQRAHRARLPPAPW